MKAKLRNKFNVSVSEVGDNDKWQRANLGISMITNERQFLDKAFHQIIDFVDNFEGLVVTNHHFDIV